jgi:putative copper export protein
MVWLVFFHVLGASVWVGGHLVLATTFLPRALKERDPRIIQSFEEQFERIGIPALLLQVITGVWMALLYVPFNEWLSLASTHHRFLWMKLGLLTGTLALAIHARLFIMPKLSADNLPSLAFHIVLVTLLAISFVLVGLSFRFNFFG